MCISSSGTISAKSVYSIQFNTSEALVMHLQYCIMHIILLHRKEGGGGVMMGKYYTIGLSVIPLAFLISHLLFGSYVGRFTQWLVWFPDFLPLFLSLFLYIFDFLLSNKRLEGWIAHPTRTLSGTRSLFT